MAVVEAAVLAKAVQLAIMDHRTAPTACTCLTLLQWVLGVGGPGALGCVRVPAMFASKVDTFGN